MGILIKHNKSTNIIHTANAVKCRASNIATVFSSEVWKDKTCFLIGGGPSLSEFDFNLLEGQLSIGVNKSFARYYSSINYAMDFRFYEMITNPAKDDVDFRKLHKKWKQYAGIKVFLRWSYKSKFDPGVYYVVARQKKSLSLDLGKGIWSGNNSGFGALMLAISLGCKKIGLLGFDLKVDLKNGKTHWHEGYVGQNLQDLKAKLQPFIECFEEFAPMIEQQGIKVINLNKDSKLRCFPFDTIDNFLE